jgi:hypothetical protein
VIKPRAAGNVALLLAVLSGLAGVSRLAAAEDPTVPADPASPEAPPETRLPEPLAAAPAPLINWRFDGQAYVYTTALARSPNSAINPGNLYVRLPNLQLNAELRPNARATSDYVDFVLHPRLTSVYEEGGTPEQESVRGYFQEAYARIKPAQNVSVTVGRELLTWGPAFFRSPSNPYYFNNARVNPIIELSGVDVARASYSAGSQWTVTGGMVFHSGHDLVANDAYKDSLLLKADYQGSDYAGSLILASRRGESVFTGGYAQATINDAVLAYGEFGANSAERAAETEGTTLTPAIYSTRRSVTGLIGASYTFGNGTSIYGEYLYNGFGFNIEDEHRFIAQARQEGMDALLGGSLGGIASSNLGNDASRSQNLLGQHYLYLQYQNNPAQGDTLWRLMAAHNLTDHSTQFSAYLEQNISERVSLYALGVYNAGSPNSEFPALFRVSVTAGAKVFLF